MGKRFSGICIITNQVSVLRDFYQRVLEAETEGDETHAVIFIPGALLTIFSAAGMEDLAPGSMTDSGNGRYTVEFEVEAVDREFARLQDMGVIIVKPPTTYPWGRRAFWFRDPDGNIVNFYSGVKAR